MNFVGRVEGDGYAACLGVQEEDAVPTVALKLLPGLLALGVAGLARADVVARVCGQQPVRNSLQELVELAGAADLQLAVTVESAALHLPLTPHVDLTRFSREHDVAVRGLEKGAVGNLLRPRDLSEYAVRHDEPAVGNHLGLIRQRLVLG